MKFHENTSSGSHPDTCGKTETGMAKLRDTPCSYGNMPKMAGAISLLLHAFMDWTGTAVPLPFRYICQLQLG